MEIGSNSDLSKRKEYNDEWYPHNKMHDEWRFCGILYDNRCDVNAYSYDCSLKKIMVYGSMAYIANVSVSDIIGGDVFTERVSVSISSGRKIGVEVDDDSIFIGGYAQILNSKFAVALNIYLNNCHLSLCLVKNNQEDCFGDTNGIVGFTDKKPVQSLSTIVLPNMTSSGKLTINNRTILLSGTSVAERTFGNYWLKYAEGHGEKFNIFFNNGDQMILFNLPFIKKSYGKYFPDQAESSIIDEFSIEATEYKEVNDWRFGSVWYINIPGIQEQKYFIIPLIDEQFALPCSWITAGVYNCNGDKVGYCIGELLPGARNELEKIAMSLFKK